VDDDARLRESRERRPDSSHVGPKIPFGYRLSARSERRNSREWLTGTPALEVELEVPFEHAAAARRRADATRTYVPRIGEIDGEAALREPLRRVGLVGIVVEQVVEAAAPRRSRRDRC
jgi:hypothetical protein